MGDHLEDRSISRSEEATVAADEYELIHKARRIPTRQVGQRKLQAKFHRGREYWSGSSSWARGQTRKATWEQSKDKPSLSTNARTIRPHCSYCNTENHSRASCFKRKHGNCQLVGLLMPASLESVIGQTYRRSVCVHWRGM